MSAACCDARRCQPIVRGFVVVHRLIADATQDERVGEENRPRERTPDVQEKPAEPSRSRNEAEGSLAARSRTERNLPAFRACQGAVPFRKAYHPMVAVTSETAAVTSETAVVKQL